MTYQRLRSILSTGDVACVAFPSEQHFGALFNRAAKMLIRPRKPQYALSATETPGVAPRHIVLYDRRPALFLLFVNNASGKP